MISIVQPQESLGYASGGVNHGTYLNEDFELKNIFRVLSILVYQMDNLSSHSYRATQWSTPW